MPQLRFRILALLAVLACAGVVIACSGGSSSKNTATVASGSSAVATGSAARATAQAVPTAAIDIRALDLSQNRDVAALVTDSGGTFSATDVLFTDLTGDGVDEAIVPITSGGTAGDIAFVVLQAKDDRVVVLLKEYPADQMSLAVEVKDGKLLMTQPVPGPEDPLCCPSFLRHTTYGWNGFAMAIESVTTDANPGGGAKGTASVPVTRTAPASAPASDATPTPPAFAPEGTAASGNRPRPPAPGSSP